jgi:hypothetical protein
MTTTSLLPCGYCNLEREAALAFSILIVVVVCLGGPVGRKKRGGGKTQDTMTTDNVQTIVRSV